MPIGASDIPLPPMGVRMEGHVDTPTRAATEEDMTRIRGEYRTAAERAKRVGFDGIELHCGYGFLLD